MQFMRFLTEIIKAVIDIERFILQYFTQSLSESIEVQSPTIWGEGYPNLIIHYIFDSQKKGLLLVKAVEKELHFIPPYYSLQTCTKKRINNITGSNITALQSCL